MQRRRWTRGQALVLTAGALGVVFALAAGLDLDDRARSRAAVSAGEMQWHSAPTPMRSALKAWQKGQKERAVEHAKRALRERLRDIDRENALHIACVGETELGRAEAALPQCDEAVEMTGAKDWRHLNNRANALLLAGRVAEAVDDYQAALSLLDAQGDAASDELRSLLAGNLDLALETNARLQAERGGEALARSNRDGKAPAPGAEGSEPATD